MAEYFHIAKTRSAAESIVRDGFDASLGKSYAHELDDGSFVEPVGVWIGDEATRVEDYPLAAVVVEVETEIDEYEFTRRGEARRRRRIPFDLANASRRWVLPR